MSRREEAKKHKAGYSEILDNFIHFKGYDALDENGAGCTEIEFPYLKKKQYVLAMKICGIDIFHFQESDIYAACRSFAAATNALRCNYKYIFTSDPADLSAQRRFLEHKRERTDHAFRRKMLELKLAQLDYAEQNYREKLSYLLLFGDRAASLYKQAEQFIAAMGSDTNVEICDKAESMELFCKLLRRTDLQAKNDGYDILLPDTLELGQNYVKVDDKYVSILQLDDFPAELQDLKLAQLISRIDGADMTVDVYTKQRRDALHEIDKSLDELATRHIVERKSGEALDSETEAQKLTYIRQQIANGKEQIMYLTIRIIITQDSAEKLSDAISNISLELSDDGISCFVPFNTMREEYFDLIRPSNPIETPFPLYDTFSVQYPFYFQSHLDENAAIFGTSMTKGLIALDFFKRTSKRQSYDIMLAGAKGSGKSVTLKSIMQDQLLIGNKVLCLDLEGEYDPLAEVYDGQIIRFDKNSRVNPLELTAAGTEESSEANFAAEVSRVNTFFSYIIPNIDPFDAAVLASLIQKVYTTCGITSETDLGKLTSSDYPTLSDLLSELRHELYAADNSSGTDMRRRQQRLDALERLEVSIEPITEGTYMSMFNGSTNISVRDADFVAFNVRELASMEARIYDAQLFNILSLMWQEVCKNSRYNRDIFSAWDRRKVICVIDEAHRFISVDNLQVTTFIETLTRRSRKYEAGLLFASQSITDFNPPRTDREPPAANRVRTIFSLTQYKMILKHSDEKQTALQEAFPQFTLSELKDTSNFASGEMLVSLGAGRSKFHCFRTISRLDLMYIGNSEDRSQIVHGIFNELYTDDKRKYAAILRESERNIEQFVTVFAEEILQQLGGIVRADSEPLYQICRRSAQSIANELISNYSY